MNAFVGSLLERVLEQTSPNEPRSVTFPLPDDKEIERVFCLCLGRMGNYKLQSKQSGLYGHALQFREFFCQVGDLEVIDAVINKIEFIQFCGFIVDLPSSDAESAGERRAQLHGDW